MIRLASRSDLDGLVDLEQRCFSMDRMSRRSFRHLLTRGHATVLVAEAEGRLAGYAAVLYSRATALARLYSIAVDASQRGRGIARQLLESAEANAREHGCVTMRSEVRRDNEASLSLFRKSGYRLFDEVDDYYEDHVSALRFERVIAPQPDLVSLRVPYYQQTTDFSCGPACLMMAMSSLDPHLQLDRKLELRLWRESTSIFMNSGHGGCGPYGLALAAYRRGFAVDLFLRERGVFLVDTVRSPAKKEVMAIVEEDYLEQLEELDVPISWEALSFDELERRFEAGAVPLLLISSWRIYHERYPHWVVLTGFDSSYAYVHDPFVDPDSDDTVAERMTIPIARAELERMARYGRSGQQAALLISPGRDLGPSQESAPTTGRESVETGQ